jgi:hypothetical protein
MKRLARHWTLVSLMAVFCLLLSATTVQADDETAASGNGGTGTGNANGGAAALGDIESGENLGNALGLGDTGGGEISGGSVANSTDVTAALDGGTGIADATGGDDNIAFTLEPVPPAPNPDPVPPAPEPPAPTPEPIPQVCVTGLLGGVSCTFTIDCSFVDDVVGTTCFVPDCNTALGLPAGPPLPCIGLRCVPGPNATTNCVLVLP